MRVLTAFFLFCIASAAQNASPAKAEANLNDADEVRIGRILSDQFIKLEGLQSTAQITKIEGYLQSVGDRLAAHTRRKLPYRFHFDPNPTFKSAFALPGGEVFVGGGVLAMMDTEDQLAIVLGHEMQHVILNQCRNRLTKELADKHLTVETAEQLKVDPFLPGYGHDNEFKADLEGVRLAAQAGYSPQSAIRLLNMYVILGQQMTNTPSEAENNLKNRIAQIKQLIESDKLATPKEKPLAMP